MRFILSIRSNLLGTVNLLRRVAESRSGPLLGISIVPSQGDEGPGTAQPALTAVVPNASSILSVDHQVHSRELESNPRNQSSEGLA